MAFRDPLTSLPAAGIIGLIQGSQLAADSIDGKVITGATIRTAAAGNRWQMVNGLIDTIEGYSGDGHESLPAVLKVYKDALNVLLKLASPKATGSQATLELRSSILGGGGSIVATSDLLETSAALRVDTNLNVLGTAQILGNTEIDGNLLIVGLGGLTVDHINGRIATHTESGVVLHAYGGGVGPVTTNIVFATAFAAPPAVTVSCNSFALQVEFGGLGAAGVAIISKGFNGVVPASASYQISWTATGPVI